MPTCCSSIIMYCSNIIFLFTQPYKWWYQIFICLDRSWNTEFLESLMQLWLSQNITIGCIIYPNSPRNIFLIHITFDVAWLATMYYASFNLGIIDILFLLYYEIATDPTLKIPHDVLFRYDGIPTKWTFVKP